MPRWPRGRSLGPEYEPEIIDAFLEKLDARIAPAGIVRPPAHPQPARPAAAEQGERSRRTRAGDRLRRGRHPDHRDRRRPGRHHRDHHLLGRPGRHQPGPLHQPLRRPPAAARSQCTGQVAGRVTRLRSPQQGRGSRSEAGEDCGEAGFDVFRQVEQQPAVYCRTRAPAGASRARGCVVRVSRRRSADTFGEGGRSVVEQPGEVERRDRRSRRRSSR